MRDRKKRAELVLRRYHEKTELPFIGGLPVPPDGSATVQLLNPASGEIVGRIAAGNARDIERAVDAAESGFASWSALAPGQRGRVLLLLADLLEREAEDLALLEAMQTGRTFREIYSVDLPGAIEVLRFHAGFAGKRPGEVHDLGSGVVGLTRLEPHPVIGVLLSWQAPLATAVRKLAPALALGSAVVVKPPVQAPLAVHRLAELATEAGLPPGALNVVTGFGAQAGEALALHPAITLLAYTGSIETARRVLVSAAKSNLKHVAFELGGKCANIVFDDADARQAITAVGRSIFSSAATTGAAGARLIVHESLYESFATTLTARAREVLLGDPLDEHTELGPMISEEHMKRVLAYVELGRREGAVLVAGGKRDVDGRHSAGFFVQPSVFIDVRPAMRIAREEIGGPVLTITPFSVEDEAIEIANGTEYGLAAGVWTESLGRAHRVAERLKAGVVWVNQYGRVDPALPLGGVDLSGLGRDLGRFGMDQYSRPKAVYLPSR